MPRYFFDVFDGDYLTSDPTGNELESSERANCEAVALLPDVAAMVFPDGDLRTVACVVRDVEGNKIFRATMILKCERLF